MIPSTDDILTTDIVVESYPSLTYKMNIEYNRINGNITNLDAIQQTVYKILNTERYQYLIYSWDYGIELVDLYGKSTDYVCSELQRRITEALTADDRITGCSEFAFDTSVKKQIVCTFTVNTIYGEITAEKVVEV